MNLLKYLYFKFCYFFYKKDTLAHKSSVIALTVILIACFCSSAYVAKETAEYIEMDLSEIPPEEIPTVKKYRAVYYIAFTSAFLCACGLGLIAVHYLEAYYQPPTAVTFSSAVDFTTKLAISSGITAEEVHNVLKATMATKDPLINTAAFQTFFPPEKVSVFFPDGLTPALERVAVQMLHKATRSTASAQAITAAAKSYYASENPDALKALCALIVSIFQN